MSTCHHDKCFNFVAQIYSNKFANERYVIDDVLDQRIHIVFVVAANH